ILCVGQRGILQNSENPPLFLLNVITLEENDSFPEKHFLTCAFLSAVIELDCLALAKLSFKGLYHVADYVPIFITTNGIDDLGLANMDMRDNFDLTIVAFQIRERRPVIILSRANRCGQRHA